MKQKSWKLIIIIIILQINVWGQPCQHSFDFQDTLCTCQAEYKLLLKALWCWSMISHLEYLNLWVQYNMRHITSNISCSSSQVIWSSWSRCLAITISFGLTMKYIFSTSSTTLSANSKFGSLYTSNLVSKISKGGGIFFLKYGVPWNSALWGIVC